MFSSNNLESFAWLVFLLPNLITASPLEKRGPICNEVVIPVTISATNARVPAGFAIDPVTFLVAISQILFDLPITGTYNIAARYCEPEVVIPSRTNTLQLLVHGATYTRNYWSGDGPPGAGYDGDRYSWIAYFSKKGYPTLSIDRLGSGLSSHPDPITVVQIPAQIETIHALITILKSSSSPLSRPFAKIIYVGHSLGSVVGNGLTFKYPTDIDATVLTGFTSSPAAPGIFTTFLLLPAATILPSRFGTLPPGYLTPSNKPGTQSLFFSNSYDPALPTYDWNLRGTITIGEAVSGSIGIPTASAYTRPVLVITGQQDQIFCNPTATSLTAGDCGGQNGYLQQTRSLYPNASNFTAVAVLDSGHCWNLHYNAQVGFGKVNDWLAGVGF